MAVSSSDPKRHAQARGGCTPRSPVVAHLKSPVTRDGRGLRSGAREVNGAA